MQENNQGYETPGAYSQNFHFEQRHLSRNDSESDDEILQKINQKFVLTNDYDRDKCTFSNFSKQEMSPDEEPSHEMNDTSDSVNYTCNSRSFLNNLDNRF